MAEKNTANIGFEKQIWDAACVLWGHIPAAEYRKVIVGLIFLRYISSAFEKRYNELIENGMPPQVARSVLPNCTKTEIVQTANLREWRHVLRQRTSKAAQPEIRELMTGLLNELKAKIPVVFDDIEG